MTAIQQRARALAPRTRDIGFAVAGFLLIAAAWQLLAAVSDPAKVPTPEAVLEAVRNDWSQLPALQYLQFQSGGIGDALAYTAGSVLVGVGIGAALGLPLGIALAWVPTMRGLLEPPLLLLGTVPLLILLPFITLWFGTSRLAQAGLVIVFAFITVVFAVQSAAMSVSGRYADFAACLGASRSRILWTIVLPAAAPQAIGAIRVALAAGWGLEAVAELLGARAGAGRIIQVTAQTLSTADLFGVLICLAILAVAIDAVVAGLGRALVPWRE